MEVNVDMPHNKNGMKGSASHSTGTGKPGGGKNSQGA